MKSLDEILREDGDAVPPTGTSTPDMAQGPGMRLQPEMSFRDLPCFTVKSGGEFHSFAKGIKNFHLWRQHTKSEQIRQWANQNPGKSFYVKHPESEAFTFINRGKRK
jgi:hypothetical protein